MYTVPLYEASTDMAQGPKIVYIVCMGGKQFTSYLTQTPRYYLMINARIRSQQLAKFEAKLNTIQAQSFKFTDANLRDLAAKRDAYLASLR